MWAKKSMYRDRGERRANLDGRPGSWANWVSPKGERRWPGETATAIWSEACASTALAGSTDGQQDKRRAAVDGTEKSRDFGDYSSQFGIGNATATRQLGSLLNGGGLLEPAAQRHNVPVEDLANEAALPRITLPRPTCAIASAAVPGHYSIKQDALLLAGDTHLNSIRSRAGDTI